MDMIERFHKAAKLFDEANSLLNHGPLSFYLKEMAGFCEYAIKNHSPYQIGDIVIWNYVPKEDEWYGCKTVRRKNASCVIRTVTCSEKGFLYEVKFSNDEHLFTCSPDKLKPLPVNTDPGLELRELSRLVKDYWGQRTVNINRLLELATKWSAPGMADISEDKESTCR
jgi:hypothetical protein